MVTPLSIRTTQRVFNNTTSFFRLNICHLPPQSVAILSPLGIGITPVHPRRHGSRWVGKLGKFNPTARHMENEYGDYIGRSNIFRARSKQYWNELDRLFSDTSLNRDRYTSIAEQWETAVLVLLTGGLDVTQQISRLDMVRRLRRHGLEALPQKEQSWYLRWSPSFQELWHMFAALADETLGGLSCLLAKQYLRYALALPRSKPQLQDPKMVNFYLALATYHADLAVALGDLEAALLLDRWEKTAYARLRDVRHANFAAARDLIKTQAQERDQVDHLKLQAVVAHTEYVCRNGYRHTPTDHLHSCLDRCLKVSETDLPHAQHTREMRLGIDNPRGLCLHPWLLFDQPEKKALDMLNSGVKLVGVEPAPEVDQLKKSLTETLMFRYNDPDALFERIVQFEQDGVPVSDSLWHHAVSAAAANGNSDACWLLAKHHLEVDGFLPLRMSSVSAGTNDQNKSKLTDHNDDGHSKVSNKARKPLAASHGAEFAEVAIHLTSPSSPTRFSNRAVALASLYLLQPSSPAFSASSLLSRIPLLGSRTSSRHSPAHEGLLLLHRLQSTASDAFSSSVARNFEVFCNDYTSVRGTFGVGPDAVRRRIELINRVWGYVDDPSVKVRVGTVPKKPQATSWFDWLT